MYRPEGPWQQQPRQAGLHLLLLLPLLLARTVHGPPPQHNCLLPLPPTTDAANATAEELDRLVTAYAHTPALERLETGWVGDVRMPLELTTALHSGVRNASRTMLRLCTETTGLLSDFRRSGVWALKGPSDNLPRCMRRLHFIMVLHRQFKPHAALVEGMWGSHRLRALMLQAHLMRRGHLVSWYSLRDQGPMFENCTQPGYVLPFLQANSSGGSGAAGSGYETVDSYTPVAVAVKYIKSEMAACLGHHRVPMVLDVIDSGVSIGQKDMSWYKFRFMLLLTTNRLASMVFERNAGVRSHVVYHQAPNAFGIRREDRSAPVRRVGLIHQMEHHMQDNVVLQQVLEAYCSPKGIEVVAGEYAGDGFSQEEMRAFALEQQNNAGEQMGYTMGNSVVDVAVLWLACDRPILVCSKPVTRLLASLSLGIPTIAIGSAAYLDIAVQYGYPLIATSMEHAVELLNLLVADPKLRQAVSQLGLRISADLSLQHIVDAYERAVCQAVETAEAVGPIRPR